MSKCIKTKHEMITINVSANQDSLTVSPFMFSAIQKDQEEFNKYSRSLTEMIGKDYTTLPRAELKTLLSDYYLTQQKMGDVINRLRNVVLKDNLQISCIDVKP